ncbi:MAG: hypothetical protein AAGI71_13995 [Bacteroidota bacterium]
MVDVRLEGDTVVFDVRGLHQLWAFKGRLDVPRAHIQGARRDPDVVQSWKGWRAPGTSVPGLITAGTFHLDGDRIFWDVSDASKAIVVDLADHDYRQLVIEVANPDAVVALLNRTPTSSGG